MLSPGATIGILGGGQLGRMLALAAAPLGFRTTIFDPTPDSPAFAVSGQSICAPWNDEEALARFARLCDVITLEFENVPVETVAFLDRLTPVRPGCRSLEVSQDRLLEKQFITELGIAVAPFVAVNSPDELAGGLAQLGSRAILKTRRLGYDGKGQVRLDQTSDLHAAWQDVAGAPCVLEGLVGFAAETSAIIARGLDGQVVAWDCPANVHAGGILRRSSLPGPLDQARQDQAIMMASQIGKALDHVGILTVEFFLDETGGLIVNEIAPRTHNSGHWTIEGAHTSQFTNNIRAVAGWPLSPTTRRFAALEMVNLIGDDIDQIPVFIQDNQCWLHLYGKSEARAGRKMGHVTQVRHCLGLDRQADIEA